MRVSPCRQHRYSEKRDYFEALMPICGRILASSKAVPVTVCGLGPGVGSSTLFHQVVINVTPFKQVGSVPEIGRSRNRGGAACELQRSILKTSNGSLTS